MTALCGIVLAAGAGSRMGMPKALMRTPDGTPWVARATGLLRSAGCDRVLVVLGAAADEARALVPAGAEIVVAEDWADGLGSSLRTAIAAATGDAVLITLVDLPSLPSTVVERVLEASGDLRQAVFDGRPGHPVYMSRDRWAAATLSLHGDNGARGYLVAHGVTEVECGDLWDGRDVDVR